MVIRKTLLFLVVTCFAVNIGNAAYNKDKKRVAKEQHTVQQGLSKANDLLDYMLTIKGATKVAVLLSPLVYAYCSYYGVSPSSSIVNKMIQMIGNAKANYDIQIKVGKSQAFWNNLLEHPISAVSTFGSELFYKTVKCGIPFLAVLLIKLGLGVK